MGTAEMGQNASDPTRRRPAHGAWPVSTAPHRSWGLGRADPLAHSKARPLLAQAWGQGLLAPVMPPGLLVESREPSEKRAFSKQA